MTDVERMTEEERRLRAELARTLVPPPVPESLRALVDALAVERLAGTAPTGRSWREALGMGARGLRVAAGVLAVLVVAVVAVLALRARGEGDVAATPMPTIPAMTGPALPSPAAVPTRLSAAGWIDASTAIAALRDRSAFRISADGGQTWGEERAFPQEGIDLGFGFTDATHGYSMAMEGAALDPQQLNVKLTDDGGRTWRTVTPGSLPGGGEDVYGQVHFSDALHGVALGTRPIVVVGGIPPGGKATWCFGWTTSDGGASWTKLSEAPCLWAGGISWPTATLGYIVLSGGETWTTTDGGSTWGHGQLPDPGAGVEIWTKSGAETSTGAVRIVGGLLRSDGDAAPPLVVWQSDAAGTTWREFTRNNQVRITSIEAVTAFDADHWLATEYDDQAILGGSVLMETFDGGRTWTQAGATDIQTGGAVAWADRLHGTIQGSRMIPQADGSSEGYVTTWLTNDGGRTWHEVPF